MPASASGSPQRHSELFSSRISIDYRELPPLHAAMLQPPRAHRPDALSQGDPRPWPAHHSCPVGRLCHLEVVHASDMLNDAVACVDPDVDAEGEVRLGLHGGQIRLDWPAPRAIYTPCCCVTRVPARMASTRPRVKTRRIAPPNVGYEHSVMKEKEHHEERSGTDRGDKDSRQARHN